MCDLTWGISWRGYDRCDSSVTGCLWVPIRPHCQARSPFWGTSKLIMWGAGVTMDKSQGWGQQAAIDYRIKERNWWVGQIISYYLNWGHNYYFLSSEFGETMPDSAEGQWEIFSDTVAANIFSGKVEPGRRRTEKQLNIPWKPPFCINVGAPTCFNIQTPLVENLA